MKFFEATLSDDSFIYIKNKNINEAEVAGEWVAERKDLELTDIEEISEERFMEMKDQ
jgi:hypothetical protein